jgi:hypothetical protein
MFREGHGTCRDARDLARTGSSGPSASASDCGRSSLDELMTDTAAPGRDAGHAKTADHPISCGADSRRRRGREHRTAAYAPPIRAAVT